MYSYLCRLLRAEVKRHYSVERNRKTSSVYRQSFFKLVCQTISKQVPTQVP